MAEYILREAAIKRFNFAVLDCLGMEPTIRAGDIIKALESIPAAVLPPALWTDEPIIVTEFMTHNQGQHGFEIHFRTDNKAKYEAVQDECRRQIDHAKPAADVRPVVKAEWYGEADGYADGELVYDMWSCPVCGKRFEEWEEKPDWNFCPNCGADMRGTNDEKA